MIEPTETETKETLDEFVGAMLAIATEAHENPELVKTAPHSTVVGRMDEARAARQPRLRWSPSPTASPAANAAPSTAPGTPAGSSTGGG
jgi:glycine dehydrogenase subunit 2